MSNLDFPGEGDSFWDSLRMIQQRRQSIQDAINKSGRYCDSESRDKQSDRDRSWRREQQRDKEPISGLSSQFSQPEADIQMELPTCNMEVKNDSLMQKKVKKKPSAADVKLKSKRRRLLKRKRKAAANKSNTTVTSNDRSDAGNYGSCDTYNNNNASLYGTTNVNINNNNNITNQMDDDYKEKDRCDQDRSGSSNLNEEMPNNTIKLKGLAQHITEADIHMELPTCNIEAKDDSLVQKKVKKKSPPMVVKLRSRRRRVLKRQRRRAAANKSNATVSVSELGPACLS